MNKSGIAVKRLADHYEPEINNIIVVHDDIDLNVGRMKIVNGGGAGGHHGVESVIYHLGTNNFCRAKIGIGRPRYNEPVEDFVLSPAYEDDQKTIKGVLRVIVEAIESFILEGAESAMNKFNAITIS
jgi:PTH1 family peptidyl-tRNA hydrolase